MAVVPGGVVIVAVRRHCAAGTFAGGITLLLAPTRDRRPPTPIVGIPTKMTESSAPRH